MIGYNKSLSAYLHPGKMCPIPECEAKSTYMGKCLGILSEVSSS